jgi:hypothetical protein
MTLLLTPPALLRYSALFLCGYLSACASSPMPAPAPPPKPAPAATTAPPAPSQRALSAPRLLARIDYAKGQAEAQKTRVLNQASTWGVEVLSWNEFTDSPAAATGPAATDKPKNPASAPAANATLGHYAIVGLAVTQAGLSTESARWRVQSSGLFRYVEADPQLKKAQ